MKQAVLQHFDLPFLPLLAMALFVGCFVAYIIWTYQKSNRPMFEKVANIPLNDPAIKNESGDQL
jgi:cbb3-type cytochrome oxidase subunit 3